MKPDAVITSLEYEYVKPQFGFPTTPEIKKERKRLKLLLEKYPYRKWIPIKMVWYLYKDNQSKTK